MKLSILLLFLSVVCGAQTKTQTNPCNPELCKDSKPIFLPCTPETCNTTFQMDTPAPKPEPMDVTCAGPMTRCGGCYVNYAEFKHDEDICEKGISIGLKEAARIVCEVAVDKLDEKTWKCSKNKAKK